MKTYRFKYSGGLFSIFATLEIIAKDEDDAKAKLAQVLWLSSIFDFELEKEGVSNDRNRIRFKPNS